VQQPCNGAVNTAESDRSGERTGVLGNPDSIGRFSSGQVRPGPPYDTSNLAGAGGAFSQAIYLKEQLMRSAIYFK
jgi:hypothetical protein